MHMFAAVISTVCLNANINATTMPLYMTLHLAFYICTFLGAEGVLTNMKSMNITPNVVTLTILIKGYCEQGDVTKAWRLIAESISHTDTAVTTGAVAGVLNIRSLNTFLRGCIRVGTVQPAIQAYKSISTNSSIHDEDHNSDDDEEVEEEDKIEGHDSTTLSSTSSSSSATQSYLVTLLSQSLHLSDCTKLLQPILNGGHNSDPSHHPTDIESYMDQDIDYATIYVNISKAYASIGLFDSASEYLSYATAALER